MLTFKQEQFCRNIVNGMSKQEAYKAAYNSNGKPSTESVEANKLLLREDIQKYIKTLKKPIEKAIQTTAFNEREKVKSILWDRLQKAIDREDDQTIIKITDQINRMNSEYINVNRNIDENKVDINNLDIDTLKKLSNGL